VAATLVAVTAVVIALGVHAGDSVSAVYNPLPSMVSGTLRVICSVD
jgi:hypothetical protein